jgi:thiol:disulfide interchange protein
VDVPGAEIGYPPGESRAFAFSQQPIRIYDRQVILVVRFSQPPRSAIKVTLSYQACDDRACFPPVTKQFDVEAPA